MSVAPAKPSAVAGLCLLDDFIDPAELELVVRLRSFVRRSFIPDAGAFFARGEWPRELLMELGSLGVHDLHVSTSGSASAFGLAFLELGAGDLAFSRMVGAHAGALSMAVDGRAAPELRARWLEGLRSGEAIGCYVHACDDPRSGGVILRPAAGSVAGALGGTARQVLLSPRADVMVVRCSGGDGEPFECVVPTTAAGVAVHAARRVPPPFHGLLGDVTFDEVRVPQEAVLTPSGGVDEPADTIGAWMAYAAICGTAGAARASFEELCGDVDPSRILGRASMRAAAGAFEAGALALHLGRRWDAGCLHPRQFALAAAATTRAADEVASAARAATRFADKRSAAFRYLVARQYLSADGWGLGGREAWGGGTDDEG
ncbi:MAG: acyl-CoA dehydrogenase family protein [Actinobacteria bacterium]|nr:acyl-CoA dehydrogenase family protein [Actinomycetota bacterium]